MGTPELTARVRAMKPSATVAVSQRAMELKAQGVDVLSFSVGEPDYPTPEHVRKYAAQMMEKASHYTDVRGVPELRKAIIEDSARRRGGVTHKPDEIVVSCGAKHSLFNLAFALFEKGDEVIIPAPYWVSYPEQVQFAEATPIIAETTAEDGFKLKPDQLKKQLRPQTKAVILCTPSNPTGAAYSRDELAALAEVLRGHNCWVIVDEIYAELVYGGFKCVSILEVAPDLRDRILIVDGVSKTYAMTGWRIGWLLAPAAVAKACEKIQGQATTNPAAIAQYATIAALTGPREPIEAMRKAFEERRGVAVDGLNAIPGVKCRMPEGAFYAFADVRGLMGKRAGATVLEDDLGVSRYLLEKALIAVVPGSSFGAPGYVRFSYATSADVIRKGIERFAQAVRELT